MRIKILGCAAGGGFPQWNCACSNCSRFRQGSLKSKARSQTQLAIGSGELWLLLDASPDLRWQIEATPELLPKTPDSRQQRHSPILAAVLTCADLDRVLGLLLLREFQPFTIYATESLRAILQDDNSMFRMLHREARQVVWQAIAPGRSFAVAGFPELRLEAIPLTASYPEYVSAERRSQLTHNEAVIGISVEEVTRKRKLLYLPSLPQMDDALLQHLSACDLLLVDGTFWDDDELIRLRGSGRTAKEMGHIPISGNEGTLHRLQLAKRPRKVYIHINNTNPILDEASPAFAQVQAAGWSVASDGMEFDL